MASTRAQVTQGDDMGGITPPRTELLPRSARTRLAAALATVALGTVLGLVVLAATGGLDPTFGTDGKVTTDISGSDDEGWGLVLQSDGTALVAGFGDASGDNTANYLALARYNGDGSLDATFGSGGLVTTRIGEDSSGYAVAKGSDSRIVVAGCSRDVQGADCDFAVARYTTTGALDADFGAGGVVTTSIGSGSDQAHSVAIQSDGQIVVAGNVHVSGIDYDVALARYNSGGSLDAGFGSNGVVTTSVGVDDGAHGVAIQSDGKILVAGRSHQGGHDNFALLRYTDAGSLDTTFGSDGIVTTDFGGSNDAGSALVIQPDGKIIVVGGSNSGGDLNFALARYNADGGLDASFGANGVVTTPIGGGVDDAYAVALQADDRIVVAGFSSNGSDDDLAVARYDPDGSLDASFGTGGMVTTPIGDGQDTGYGVAVETDGKIVAAGTSRGSSPTGSDFAIVRYNSSISGSVSGLETGILTSVGETRVKVRLNSGDPGTVTAVKYTEPPGGYPPDAGEMPVHWAITASGSTYDLDLLLCYSDSELAGANETTEANLKAFKESDGTGWTVQDSTVDTDSNCVTVTGVTALSEWTIGDATNFGGEDPTVVRVRGLAADGGVSVLLVVLGPALMLLGFVVTLVRSRSPA